MTPPRAGDPPKTDAAFMPTKILSPQNAALPAMARIWMTGSCVSAGLAFTTIFTMPAMRPQAMKAGMMGTKI